MKETRAFAQAIVLLETARARNDRPAEVRAELFLRQALVPLGLGSAIDNLLAEWQASHHISPLQCEGWKELVCSTV